MYEKMIIIKITRPTVVVNNHQFKGFMSQAMNIPTK